MGNNKSTSSQPPISANQAHTFLTKEKSELLVYGCIRLENKTAKLQIPESIIELVLDWYLETFQILQFSDVFCDKKAFKFEEDRKFIIRQPDSVDRGHRFIVADIDPLMDGVHCFRAQVRCS